jgi:drug/metabolite transporter (DMT)-like permease
MQKPAPQPAAHAASRPLIAIGLMCLTCGLFACLDTTAKYLVTVTGLPILQIVWMRFLGQLLAMVAVLGLVALPSLTRARKPGLQILRSFLLLSSTAFNFLALRHLQLDQTTTINFLAPLVTAILAGPLLGEWIGWRRGVAIAVGFCGALVAIRPGIASFDPALLFAFCTMLSMASFGIITRYLAAFDRSEVTLFYSLLAGTVLMAPFALADWVWPSSGLAWVLLLSMGVYGGLGHYAFIVAHRYAPASTLAPFLYVSLVTHSTAGFLVFGQVPDRWTLAGAAIVILTGLYLLHREHVTARAAAVAMTTEAASQR